MDNIGNELNAHMFEHCLKSNNVSKYFGENRAKVSALSNVSIELAAGEMTMLVGPSGSGKTSLLAALGGLQAPDEGEVIAFGQSVWNSNGLSVRRYREKYCGYVFQSFGLFPALTALEQVAIPLKLLGYSKAISKRRAESTLEEVGLADRMASKPHQMSGGENQRVAIARMLAKGPKLIFCDEPTSALDGKNGGHIAQLLLDIACNNNAMIICVTHDERLMSYADRIIHIEDGSIIGDSRIGKTEQK